MKPWRVADQVARVHFEESRQEPPCAVSEMGARPAFNLGEIRLAEGRAELAPHRAGDVELAHLTAEAADLAFHRAQRPDLLAERHCNQQYIDCRLQLSRRLQARSKTPAPAAFTRRHHAGTMPAHGHEASRKPLLHEASRKPLLKA